MRVVEPLTDKKIRAAKADKKPVMLFDGGGLYLESPQLAVNYGG